MVQFGVRVFRKLLFIVSLSYSALFHSSAEVDYLRIKEDGIGIRGGITFKKAEGDVATNEDVVYYEEVGKGKKAEKRIVIYLPSSFGGNRVEEAKKQFENILNSGLIADGNFNLKYVDIPATWKDNEKISKTRQMPGIAVRIDSTIKKDGEKNIETFPVVRATKSAGKVGGTDATKFLTNESWESLFSKEVKNKQRYYDENHKAEDIEPIRGGALLDDGEHTERQLFYSLIYNNIISDNKGRITLQKEKAPSASESTFFVWTRGNPCITDNNFHHDNGGICCSVWYRSVLQPKLKEVSSQMRIYFNNKSIPVEGIHFGVEKEGERFLVSVLIGSQLPRGFRGRHLSRKDLEDKQVLEVRITGETIPKEFDTLLVNVGVADSLFKMKQYLSLADNMIPYIVEHSGSEPLSYSFTIAERRAVIYLLNRWMKGEEEQPTIQFADHYKN